MKNIMKTLIKTKNIIKNVLNIEQINSFLY